MKIQNDALTGANAPEASRAQEARLSAYSTHRAASSSQSADADSVSVSNLVSRIAESSAVAESRSSDRVAKLAALYARGAYVPDASQLSHAMVSRALENDTKVERG